MRTKIAVGIVLVSVLAGIGLLVLRADPKTTTESTGMPIKGTYLALGDSVAAGVGLQEPKDASACDRTKKSYPTLLANTQQLQLLDRTCSGASLGSGILGSQTVNQLLTPPQLEGLSEVQNLKLITITAGANDLDWTTLITQCLVTTCDAATNTTLVSDRIQTIVPQLREMFKNLQTYSQAQTFITGYYLLFDEQTVSCPSTEGITASEQQWIRSMQRNLNKAIQDTASEYPNIRYVAPDFTGHALCATDPYIQDTNDPQPYHPTARGQEIIAETIRKTITEQ